MERDEEKKWDLGTWAQGGPAAAEGKGSQEPRVTPAEAAPSLTRRSPEGPEHGGQPGPGDVVLWWPQTRQAINRGWGPSREPRQEQNGMGPETGLGTVRVKEVHPGEQQSWRPADIQRSSSTNRGPRAELQWGPAPVGSVRGAPCGAGQGRWGPVVPSGPAR